MLKLNAPEFPIKGVTIFRQSSKAEVVRTFDIDLQVSVAFNYRLKSDSFNRREQIKL